MPDAVIAGIEKASGDIADLVALLMRLVRPTDVLDPDQPFSLGDFEKIRHLAVIDAFLPEKTKKEVAKMTPGVTSMVHAARLRKEPGYERCREIWSEDHPAKPAGRRWL